MDGGFRDAVDKGGEEFGKNLADASPKKQALEEKLRSLGKAKELSQVVLALAAENSLREFQLDDKASLTVFVCNRQKILHRYALAPEQVTEEAVNKIAAEFEKDLQNIESVGKARRR
jgi:hypothetical protein